MQFFDFDFIEAVNGNGFIPSKLDIYQNGEISDVLAKSVMFEPPQMGMFYKLNITKLPDGTVWLDFISKKYAPNRNLMDFMAYCTDRWGLDSNSQGYPCDKDTELLKSGYFGRYWPNVKILQCKVENHLSLSIILRIIIDNEDMSNFTKQLAKGFVRSAVNQVGRDGGRVISNQIYNGQNYVPISNVSPQEASVQPQTGNHPQEMPQCVTSTTKHFTAGKMVWLTLASIIFMPVGSIAVLLYGLFLMIDHTDKIEWYTTEPSYVSDRRYKSGARYAGEITTRHNAKVEASPEVMRIKKRNATIAMAIGGIGIVLFAVMMLFAK